MTSFILISVILNIVLLGGIIYLIHPIIIQKLADRKKVIRQVTIKPEIPVCPQCKKELIGKVWKSASGYLCCQTCRITVFNNQ